MERAAVPGLETAEQDIFVQMEHLLDRDAAGGETFTHQDAEMEKRLQRKGKNRAGSGFRGIPGRRERIPGLRGGLAVPYLLQ